MSDASALQVVVSIKSVLVMGVAGADAKRRTEGSIVFSGEIE